MAQIVVPYDPTNPYKVIAVDKYIFSNNVFNAPANSGAQTILATQDGSGSGTFACGIQWDWGKPSDSAYPTVAFPISYPNLRYMTDLWQSSTSPSQQFGPSPTTIGTLLTKPIAVSYDVSLNATGSWTLLADMYLTSVASNGVNNLVTKAVDEIAVWEDYAHNGQTPNGTKISQATINNENYDIYKGSRALSGSSETGAPTNTVDVYTFVRTNGDTSASGTVHLTGAINIEGILKSSVISGISNISNLYLVGPQFGIQCGAINAGNGIEQAGTATITSYNVQNTAPVGSVIQCARLYQAAFDRQPDKIGLAYYVNMMVQGGTLDQFAENFLVSPEWQAKYGNIATITTSDYVNILYTNVLHRQASSSEVSYYAAAAANGMGRDTMVRHFADSPENVANTPALDSMHLLSDGTWWF